MLIKSPTFDSSVCFLYNFFLSSRLTYVQINSYSTKELPEFTRKLTKSTVQRQIIYNYLWFHQTPSKIQKVRENFVAVIFDFLIHQFLCVVIWRKKIEIHTDFQSICIGWLNRAVVRFSNLWGLIVIDCPLFWNT